ncbi:MAG: HEAT repeat domain-containing protein [Chloroflexi bacterium]|nr:HEAT repeat domain-containing protein [Chloroflexota bacterium]
MDNPIAEILAQIASPDPRKRAIALAVAGRLRLHPLLDRMIMALDDKDADVRATAAWALDLLGSPVSVPALVKALYDASFSVRSNAGWALVHLGQRMTAHMVVPDVVDVLRDLRHAEARHMAYLVIMRIGGEDAQRAIALYWK